MYANNQQSQKENITRASQFKFLVISENPVAYAKQYCVPIFVANNQGLNHFIQKSAKNA